MKTAKDFATEAMKQFHEGVDGDLGLEIYYNILLVLFHEAMTQPVQLGDEKPTEEGWYWYEFETGAMIVQIKQSDAVYYNNQYIGDVDILSKTGRWSHSLAVEGGEG